MKKDIQGLYTLPLPYPIEYSHFSNGTSLARRREIVEMDVQSSVKSKYRIMQIVRSGKLSRFSRISL